MVDEAAQIFSTALIAALDGECANVSSAFKSAMLSEGDQEMVEATDSWVYEECVSL